MPPDTAPLPLSNRDLKCLVMVYQQQRGQDEGGLQGSGEEDYHCWITAAGNEALQKMKKEKLSLPEANTQPSSKVTEWMVPTHPLQQ